MKIENVKVLIKDVMVMEEDITTKQPLPADKVMSYGNMEVWDKEKNRFVSAKFSMAGKFNREVGEVYHVNLDATLGNYPEETKKIRHKILSFVDKK